MKEEDAKKFRKQPLPERKVDLNEYKREVSKLPPDATLEGELETRVVTNVVTKDAPK